MTSYIRRPMAVSRREFVGGAALLGIHPFLAHAKKVGAKFKVGVTDWNLRQSLKPDAVALAKKIGFDGVQVSIGRNASGDKLPLSDTAMQKTYLELSKKERLPLASLCLDILHVNGPKSDPLGARWIAESIPIAKNMGIQVVLLPFFGKWALQTPEEMDRVGDILKELGPSAEKAGVILGLEDTISAKDNVRIMERSKSRAVKTYYDVGNSTNNGFNPVEEIRWLGKDRICEVHLKDNPGYLGEGKMKIDFPGVVDALADIGFSAWAQLETDNPSKDVEADMARNLKYIRGVIAARNGKT